MKITTSVSYIWSDRQSRYILVRRVSEKWTGPVALCKGASPQQTDLANAQTAFTKQMMDDAKQTFGNSEAIYQTLVNTLNPIVAKGPNQFGFSDAQTNVLNSQAIQGTGQQYAHAKKALAENQAAAGGGNVLLPSGVNAQQNSALASSAANQASDQLLGIQNAGYQQGYNMYESALGQLGGVAAGYNPTGFAGQATGASTAAGNSWNQIAQENQAANPFNAILGAVGGAAGAYLTGGLAKKP
jgi:hypothetical protein